MGDAPKKAPNTIGKAPRFSLFCFLSAKYIGRVIDSAEKFAVFVRMLQAASWVAVDTEADSLHAYPEKVCLIQISTVDGR